MICVGAALCERRAVALASTAHDGGRAAPRSRPARGEHGAGRPGRRAGEWGRRAECTRFSRRARRTGAHEPTACDPALRTEFGSATRSQEANSGRFIIGSTDLALLFQNCFFMKDDVLLVEELQRVYLRADLIYTRGARRQPSGRWTQR